MVLITVLAVCALSFSGTAMAKNAPGSSKWCKHHRKSTACRSSGGGGTGSPPPAANIIVSPDPVVETGGSDVYAVISVSTEAVYAEQTVEILSGLSSRCGQGVTWITDQGTFTGSSAIATVDDDGNATVTVLGGSCAPGTVPVIADVAAGTDPTYTATFTINAPAPMI
jgi:hypothetical protein